MTIFTWISCTVKRILSSSNRTETTLGTCVFEIQPMDALGISTPFGMLPAGDYYLTTRDGKLPKFTLGEGESAVDYTLQEGDLIYPTGWDSEPPTTFPSMKVTKAMMIERDHAEIIAKGLKQPGS